MPDGRYKLTTFHSLSHRTTMPSLSRASTRRGGARRTQPTFHANGSAEITFRVEGMSDHLKII